MRRFMMAVAVLGFVAAGVADAQQVAVRQPRPQVTRSYRSYSVAPATRGSVRKSGEATWRHADSKASGQYHGGR
jgi:hypothetical protein